MHRLKSYLPVLIWMAVIFAGSTDLGSSQRTSRFIGPFLRWLNPEVSEETIRAVQAVVRKGAHLTVYAVLALLTWRSRQVAQGRRLFEAWSWREAWAIVAFCCLYAISDEIHQAFVSTRQGSPWDVLIDTAGALLAMVLVWRLGRWRKNW